jgi:transcriptional regulator GlxA family with amidase domain
MTRNVGIYIFDEVEVLDFAGPFEVFSTASRVKARIEPKSSRPFNVFTVADGERMVQARGGLAVMPSSDFSNHPHIDVLITPGGIVTAELDKDVVVQWISQIAESAEITASVCTGASLLGKAGLLAGKTATTHWEDIAELQAMFPDISVKENTRWVDEGSVITSAGISAGIDMSLHLVARLEGEELARKTARQMEFDWKSFS